MLLKSYFREKLALSRSERLLDLIQILRRHRYPIQGAALAQELNISLRTLYRDIALLNAQGARIDGEAGLGYLMRPGFMLPPIMLQQEEIEALWLGSNWVMERADERLSAAARNALAKIAAVLPTDLKESMNQSPLLVGPNDREDAYQIDLTLIRQSIRSEQKIEIHYEDLSDRKTSRIIWPIVLTFFEQVLIIVAWCELRQGFRHFRADRIATAVSLGSRYPRRRHALMKEWRLSEGIPSP